MSWKTHLQKRIKLLNSRESNRTGLMLMSFVMAVGLSAFVIQRAEWRNGGSCDWAPQQSFCR